MAGNALVQTIQYKYGPSCIALCCTAHGHKRFQEQAFELGFERGLGDIRITVESLQNEWAKVRMRQRQLIHQGSDHSYGVAPFDIMAIKEKAGAQKILKT